MVVGLDDLPVELVQLIAFEYGMGVEDVAAWRETSRRYNEMLGTGFAVDLHRSLLGVDACLGREWFRPARLAFTRRPQEVEVRDLSVYALTLIVAGDDVGGDKRELCRLVKLVLKRWAGSGNAAKNGLEFALRYIAINGSDEALELVLSTPGMVDVDMLVTVAMTQLSLGLEPVHLQMLKRCLEWCDGAGVDSWNALALEVLPSAIVSDKPAYLNLFLARMDEETLTGSESHQLSGMLRDAVSMRAFVSARLICGLGGVDVGVRDSIGRSSLYFAASHGSSSMLEVLLNKARAEGAAAVNGNEPKSPLIIAARSGFVECVRMLLAAREEGIVVVSAQCVGLAKLRSRGWSRVTELFSSGADT